MQDIDEEVARLNRIVNEVLDFARPIPFELADRRPQRAVPRGGAGRADRRAGACSSRLSLAPGLAPIADRRRAAADGARQHARERPPRRPGAPGRPVRGGRSWKTPASTLRPRRFRTAACASPCATRARASTRRSSPRVFEPYFTTKRAAPAWACHRQNIVEGLGGTIDVASDGRQRHRPIRSRTAAAAAARVIQGATFMTTTRLDPARRRRGEDPEGARPRAARRRPRGGRGHAAAAAGAAPARRAAVRRARRRQPHAGPDAAST